MVGILARFLEPDIQKSKLLGELSLFILHLGYDEGKVDEDCDDREN